jgi:hypothetical protein
VRRRIALLLAALAFPLAGSVAHAAPPAIKLSASAAVDAGARAGFRGRVTPPLPGARVGIFRGGSLMAGARVRRGGTYYVSARIRTPGPYTARLRGAVSKPVTVTIRPRLRAALVGEQVVGAALVVVASLDPPAAGALRVRVLRGGEQTFVRLYRGSARVQLGTASAAPLRVEVESVPRRGYALRRASLAAALAFPELQPGATGAGVVALRQRLAQLGYGLPAGGASFSYELRDSVYAFQKVQGLSRTGSADRATWRRLAHPLLPQPRFAEPATHVEVDKTRQVLLDVREGQIARILPVSTAGIAGYHTPEGRFAFYRKVAGYDSSPLGVLLNPLYFVGGYAIHGNPNVPPYPASHGCVRIPNWASYSFYASHGYGETVYVY